MSDTIRTTSLVSLLAWLLLALLAAGPALGQVPEPGDNPPPDEAQTSPAPIAPAWWLAEHRVTLAGPTCLECHEEFFECAAYCTDPGPAGWGCFWWCESEYNRCQRNCGPEPV